MASDLTAFFAAVFVVVFFLAAALVFPSFLSLPLEGQFMLVKQIKEGRADVENEYGRLVKKEGNPRAIKLLEQVFKPVDRAWRGFPMVKFELNVGVSDGMNKVELADFVARTARVNDIVIGQIEIGPSRSIVEVHKDVGLKVLRALRQSSFKGKRLSVTPKPQKR